MKTVSLSLFLLVFWKASFEQKLNQVKKDSAFIAGIKTEYVKADTIIAHEKNQEDYRGEVSVYDFRTDTSCIGIYWKPGLNAFLSIKVDNKKVSFINGLSSELTRYFKSLINVNHDSAGIELACFIKKFWISGKDTIKDGLKFQEARLQIAAEAECYYKINNLYYPACRLDTIIFKTAKSDLNCVHLLTNEFLKCLTNKINQLSFERVLKRNGYPEDSITRRYNRNHSFPILTGRELKKGIYKNFEEFKLNAPSITNFSVTRDKFGTISLLDNEKNYINTIKNFGFCDGTNTWILWGNYCFPLIKNGNSYGFLLSPHSYRSIKLFVNLQMESSKGYY